MEEENITLKDVIIKNNKLLESLIESGKIKPVKNKRLSGADKKKGFVKYIFIGENLVIRTFKIQVDEGTTLIDKIPRIATAEYIMSWDGDPTIIQPAWTVEPFLPSKNFDEATRDKMLSAGYRLLANRIELGQVKGKKNLPGWLIFAGVIALIVVGYLLLS